jgi:diguanylate cyclase (GGDEF)-like protein
LLSNQTTAEQIDAWRAATSENEHLEFKEAKNQFDFQDLLAYCVALANERGGVLLLGVANKPPRPVVGTKACSNVVKTTEALFNKLRFRVDVEEVQHPDGRVLVFHIPPRSIGQPYHLDGRYLMRSGESLVPMSPDQLRQIFDEHTPVINDPASRYDEVLASQILSKLDEHSAHKSSLHQLKTGLPDFVIRTDEEWLLTVEALNKMGLIEGTFHRLGFNKVLRGAENLQITKAGIEYVRQARSELAAYVSSESPDLDPLTHVFKRTQFHRDLFSFSAQANEEEPLTLIVFAMDNFKAVNDRYGPEEGDIVLRQTALVLRRMLGRRGESYRIGGDEFAALLPNHSLAEGEALAKRICTVISGSGFDAKIGQTKITASAGIASIPESTLESQDMIQDADAALYKAKRDGGNRAYVSLQR